MKVKFTKPIVSAVVNTKYLFLDIKSLSNVFNTKLKQKSINNVERKEDNFRIKTYFVKDCQEKDTTIKRDIKFADLVEVNEYSPINIKMDVDWQSSDFLEDNDYESVYEIQESFLA